MKKFFTSLAILFLVFSGYFQSPVPVYAQPDESLSIQSQGQSQPSIESALSGCNIVETFSLCILWLIYHVVLATSTFILALAAKVFDFFISYSLNSNSYTNEFITKGWALIRDLANVMFIFTLLYLAIKHILGGSAKNHIPILIIIALLINFSLFFTKVAIDAGNILARAFYNSMNIENDTSASEYGYKSISVAIVNKINPQQLLSQDFFKPKYTTGDLSSSTGTITQTGDQNMTQNLNDNFWWYAFIFILLAIINFILALTFLSMALLFLGRVIGLWFAMIFSPVAFITLAVPGVGGMVSKLNFNSWKDLVLKQAFLAPIVMFFLYLTVMFLQIMFTTITPQEGQDTFMKIMGILIPFIFIVLILNTAKKVANDMSGEIGKAAKEWGGKAVGFVGGAALGATAFTGRRIIGGAAAAISRNVDFDKNSTDASKSRFYRWRWKQMQSLNSAAESGTYDVRNMSKMKNWVGKTAGFAGGYVTNAASEFGVGKGGFGKGTDLSYKKIQDDAKKKALDESEKRSKVDYSDMSDEEKRDIIDVYKKANEEIVAALEKNNKDLRAVFNTNNANDLKKIEELKNKPQSGFGSITEQEKRELSILEDKIKNSEEARKIAQNESKIKDIRSKNSKKEEEILKDAAKEESKNRRNTIASDYEKDVFGQVDSFFGGVNRKSIANDIRKGKKNESDEEKFVKAAKKLAEKEEKEAKPEEPKPDAGNPPPSNP